MTVVTIITEAGFFAAASPPQRIPTEPHKIKVIPSEARNLQKKLTEKWVNPEDL